MSRRYPTYPLARRGEVVDAESARIAIAQVLQQRDVLAQQLSHAQATIASLRRQLQARAAESAHLAQALRSLEPRHAPGPPVPPPAPHSLQRQLEAAEARIEQLQLRCEEALAERDREHAARRAAQAQAHTARAPEPDRLQRLAADLANVRRHQGEAIERGIRQGTAQLLAELVSIRDTVDRAIATSPQGPGPWHDGLVAIRSRVDASLARQGARPFGRAGERFDPGLHEPLGIVQGSPPETIDEVVSSGLALDDGTVVVPARVIITA